MRRTLGEESVSGCMARGGAARGRKGRQLHNQALAQASRVDSPQESPVLSSATIRDKPPVLPLSGHGIGPTGLPTVRGLVLQ